MEVKYPRLKKGLNLIYISIWIEIFGNMLQWGFNYAGIILGQPLGFHWITGIVGAVSLVLFLFGTFNASKERKKYMTVFLFVIGSQVVAFWHGVFSSFDVLWLNNSMGIISKIVSWICICLLLAETSKFLKEEGAENIAKLSIPVYVGCAINYGGNILLLLLSMMTNRTSTVNVAIALMSMLGYAIGRIMYIVFFNKASNFVEELKVERESAVEVSLVAAEETEE